MEWLSIAKLRLPQYGALLATRLAEQPDDVVLLRTEQDDAKGAERDAICARHRQRASAAPDNPDLAYLAARCLTSPEARMTAFLGVYRRWPKHGWLAMGVGYAYTGTGQWREGGAPLDQARGTLRPLSGALTLDLARIYRVVDPDSGVMRLTPLSQPPQTLFELEEGVGFYPPP